MKIFIQKSNRSIRLIHRYFFNSIYHHDLFSIFRKKFSFQKSFQKKPAKRAISSKIEFSRSTLPSFQGSFDLGNFQFQLGRKKNQKGLEKSFVRFGNSIGAFSSANFFASQRLSRSSICKTTTSKHLLHANVATRDPESSTSGLFERGSCSKHVPLARSNFLSNARPTPRGERSQEGWDEAAITRFVIRARLSKNVFA